MSTPQRAWTGLRKQVAANPRLKWALLAIAVLLAALAWQQFASLRQGVQKQAMEEEVKLRRMRALRGQDVWLKRADETAKLREALWAEVPVVATPGLAQAALQSWLRALADSASDTRDVSIHVPAASAVEQVPGIIKVRATLNAGMPPRQAMMLVKKIEGATNLIVIETLNISSDQNKTMALTLAAYYRVSAQSADAKAEAAPQAGTP